MLYVPGVGFIIPGILTEIKVCSGISWKLSILIRGGVPGMRTQITLPETIDL